LPKSGQAKSRPFETSNLIVGQELIDNRTGLIVDFQHMVTTQLTPGKFGAQRPLPVSEPSDCNATTPSSLYPSTSADKVMELARSDPMSDPVIISNMGHI